MTQAEEKAAEALCVGTYAYSSELYETCTFLLCLN